jgi:tetratricopeptide (TPR) repeat protein
LLGRFSPRALWLLPILAAALAHAASIEYGFVGDARFLIEHNRLLDTAGVLETASRDYFWSSSGESLPYWRPVTKVSWLLEARAFGRSAPLFHAVQVGWLLLAVGGVVALVRALGGPPGWAALGGLLFGLHPSVAEPASLVMARSDVVSTACVVWALVGWLRWRHAGRRAWMAVHLVAAALALGSKESAVILAPAVTAFALQGRDRRAGLLASAPAWALVAAFLVVRAQVLHGAPSTALVLDATRLFVGGGVYLRALLPFRLDSGVWNLPLAVASSDALLAATAATWVGVAVLVGVAIRARRFDLLALAAWGLGSLAPVLLTASLNVPGVAGKLPLADRWILQAVAASACAWALVGAQLPRRAGRWIAAAVIGWSVVAAIALPRRSEIYRDEGALLRVEERAYQATPPLRRTHEDRCRHVVRAMALALAADRPQEAVAAFDGRPAGCREEGEQRFNLLSALVRLRRFADAVPVAERLLAGDKLQARSHGELAYLAGVTFLETGAPHRALPLFVESQRLGSTSCASLLHRGRAEAALGRFAEAAPRLEAAARCSGQASAWLMAADLHLRLGDRARAAVLLAEARRLPLDDAQRAFADRLAAALR